jgi:hypothetical protein
MFAMKHPVLTSHDNYVDGEGSDDGQGTAKDKYSSESRYVQEVTVHPAINCFFTIFPVLCLFIIAILPLHSALLSILIAFLLFYRHLYLYSVLFFILFFPLLSLLHLQQ